MIAAFLLLGMTSTPLHELDLSLWVEGFGSTQAHRMSNGGPLRVAGRDFPQGVGSHAPGGATYDLDRRASSISGMVGVGVPGGGSVVFSIWGDSRLLWESSRITGGDQPVPFQVNLQGVDRVSLVMSDAQDGMGADHAHWLDVRIAHQGAPPRALPFMRPLVLHPERTRQTIANFGASDAWTVEHLINWPVARRREVARLLFCQATGAGLSGWRYNLGGGINHETITIPFRTIDTFDEGEGQFDFTRKPGQRWMLRAARDHGVSQIVAFAKSPPRRMTLNGFTNGTDGVGSTNLKPGYEDDFARFLTGAVQHFRSQGYPITHISPINEPDFEWNGVPNMGSQEGNRASNEDIIRITTALAESIRERGMPVRVLAPEATSPQVGYERNQGMEREYGSPFGAYVTLMAERPEWLEAVNPVYAYHSYWSDRKEYMVGIRRRLRQELDRVPGVEVWQTEYCQLAGPRNEGGWGRDLGMTLALNIARLIHFDLTIVESTAWQWWLAVSEGDYKDGLVYVDDLGASDGDIYPSKSLWVMGNFSRFVRPGFERIETTGPVHDVTATMASAYRDPRTGRLVVVFVNPEGRTEHVDLRVEGQWRASAWITSDRPGHDLAPMPNVNIREPLRIPSRSVITLVLDPA